jgi:hypothetical protein
MIIRVTLIYYPYTSSQPCQLRIPVTVYVSVDALKIASRLLNSTTRFLTSFPNVISNYANKRKIWVSHKEVLMKAKDFLGCYAVSTGKTVSDVSEKHAVSICNVCTVQKLFLDCYLPIDKA